MNKIAFELGPLTIHWYGIFVAAGFLAGLWTASRRGLKHGIGPDVVYDLGPWLILGAVVGARVLYVISYWKEQFADKPLEMFMIHRGGLIFYGGLIGASLSVLIYMLVKKLPVWKIADVMAPSIALGSVFGRVGCFMNSCCYGKPTGLPWAVHGHFDQDHPFFGVGLHPTQLYDSFLNLALYLGLAWMYRRKKFDGQIFAMFLIGYAVLRAIAELFRGDYPIHYLGGIATPAQLISALILTTGVILFWCLSKRRPAMKAPAH